MEISEVDFVKEISVLCKLERPKGIDIIGLTLLNLGVRDNDFGNNVSTKDILRNFFGFSDKVSHWADKIQYYQDSGHSWKDSLFKADQTLLLNILSCD